VIPGSGFDHFRVQFTPDTIAYRDTSRITVTAVDAGNQEVSLGGSTLLTFTLDSTRYGQFINPSGQLVSSPLSNVSYSDAKAGNVRFVANGARDTIALKSISVRVDGSQHTGSGWLYVGNIKLQFVDKNPRKLWPYIDDTSKGANRPGYKPTRGFVIQLTHPNGSPFANHSVMIQTCFVAKSGGHGHKFSGDTIMASDLQGRFWAQGKNNHNPLSGLISDANGRITVDSLRASPFSGTFSVLAILESDSTISDSILLDVCVDSLVALGQGSYWNLTGTTSDSGSNHLSNHWSHQKVKDTLEMVLKKVYDWARSSDGLGKTVILGVNDMSLGWGGVFDIGGEWAQDYHSLHRVGLSVDIDGAGVLRDSTGNLTKLGEKLEAILTEKHAPRVKEKQSIHFEFNHNFY
jgi:hypothetical protein